MFTFAYDFFPQVKLGCGKSKAAGKEAAVAPGAGGEMSLGVPAQFPARGSPQVRYTVYHEKQPDNGSYTYILVLYMTHGIFNVRRQRSHGVEGRRRLSGSPPSSRPVGHHR